MQIAIVGAGGVGAYLGVLLADRGDQIVLIDQGEHVQALASEGVHIQSRARGSSFARLPTTDRPDEVGPVDLVLYCVKTYDNASAIPALRPLIGPGTSDRDVPERRRQRRAACRGVRRRVGASGRR